MNKTSCISRPVFYFLSLFLCILVCASRPIHCANATEHKVNSESSSSAPDLSTILRNAPAGSAAQLPPKQATKIAPKLYAIPAHPAPPSPPYPAAAIQENSLHSSRIAALKEAVDAEIAANDQTAQTVTQTAPGDSERAVLINFNNVNIVEYIRFISRITNRNFVFDETDLQFNVTIISEEPTSIENVMAALLQELRIHDLNMFEEGNNLVIHKSPKVNAISKVIGSDLQSSTPKDTDIVTQVFSLNILDADKASLILRPLTSDTALIEVLKDTNSLIITDLKANLDKIQFLLKSIDAPNSGLVIGQYVSKLTPLDTLITLAQQIMQPISLDQPLTFVSHTATNSIFVISTSFLVERTVAILQYLDEDQGATRILNLKDLRLGAVPITPRAGLPPGTVPGAEGMLRTPGGHWEQDANGNWHFVPDVSNQGNTPPTGHWVKDANGNWNFEPGANEPGGPLGRWVKDQNGNWVYELSGEEPFNPGELVRQAQGAARLPGGLEKKAKFSVFKLRYRKGDTIEKAIRQIADTIQQNERGNEDLVSTLRSVQWLETPNSLVFSGIEDSLDKAYYFVKELDTPMRQVFVEMLLLDTSINDSLTYGVTAITRFGGGNLAGGQSFYNGSSPLLGAFDTIGLNNLGGTLGTQVPLVPDPTNLFTQPGYTLGVIGQKITHCGTEFGSLGALISALHDRTKDKVIMNPKILIENNTPAEIFVGINTPYRTQSISNDRGSVLTSNFEYRDVGTTLKITPYLGHSDIITMDFEEEDSTIVSGLITNADTANTSPGPTTRINRTRTRFNIPNKYFLVISGMLQHEESRERSQIPCLGGIPLLGGAFSDKINTDTKRNLMIFIRPIIIDSEKEIQHITKHQQDVYEYKNCLEEYNLYEVDQALDFFNINKTLHPEDELECDCQ
jgi:type III secretion protein C